MKQTWNCIGLIAMAAFVGCATSRVSINPNYDISKIKRVAVLDFAPAQSAPESSAALSAVFEKALLGEGYKVVERTEVAKILTEQHFQLTGAVDPSQAVTLG